MVEFPKLIVLKSLYGRYDEGRAAEGMLPGHLLARNATSLLIKHAVAGGPAEVIFAKENGNIGGTIDDAYVSGDLVPYHIAAKGDEIYAILADGQVITRDEKLSSGGDGTFIITGVAPAVPLVQSLEDVTTAGATSRVKVRVL